MPKTTKRAATKRAERVAKAHATGLTKLEVKQSSAPRRSPGYQPPKRGLARYPWGIFLSVLIIGLGIYSLYYYHVGPFAPPRPKPTPVARVSPTPVVPTATPTTTPSPCLSVVSKLKDTAPGPNGAAFNKITHTYSQSPVMAIDTNKIYCAGINTNRGLIVLELDPRLAPKTVNNFVYLAQHHFYDGMKFHRVVPKFVIQTGDPQGTGAGGPGYKFADEPVLANYTQGCVAMANSGANTNGSQFFICTADDTKALQKLYNLFGHVVQGMNVALNIQGPGDSANSKTIKPDVINHVIVVAAP
ncbi:MAG TPA: peptidylprolyl isomerase [Ktedonobacteraceae bacterium]|nr:peptidylprolyl isomerase [Ktedonobacteraceae bacterium]